MLYFDNCDVRISNTGVLADAASINSKNNIEPAYILGRRKTLGQFPEGPLETVINISHYLMVSGDPIIPLLDTLKGLTSEIPYSGLNTIVIGGITGYNCYLTNCSLRSAPNELTKLNTSFVTFENLSGQFRNKPNPQIELVSGISGMLGMGWNTAILSGGAYIVNPIYDFNYDFRANWTAIYPLNRKTPNQVELETATDRISFVKDQYFHILHSGQEASNIEATQFIQSFPADNSIDISGYGIGTFVNSLPPITISLQGARIQSSEVSARVDDFVKTTTTINSYY